MYYSKQSCGAQNLVCKRALDPKVTITLNSTHG